MKPMLAVTPKPGENIIRERELFVEAGPDLDGPMARKLADRVVTAHGPWFLPAPAPEGARCHFASVNDDLRQQSLDLFERYIEGAHRLYPELRVIVTHAAPHYFPDPPIRPKAGQPVPPLRPDLARWELLVESLQRLARKCSRLGLELVVENNWAYWDGIPDDADVESLGPGDFLEYFCSSPAEWLRLPRDVNEPNLSLCLDPSHAGPYCHRFNDVSRRREVLAEYISQPELIGHIHWNDSDIESETGKGDLHLCVGAGTLGDAFHAALKARALQLDRPVTLEHFYDVESLDKELAYIETLATP